MAHGADRPFEWTPEVGYPGPCPVCKGTGIEPEPSHELRLALCVIEEMAEERHMVHGGIGGNFWGCTRPCCKKASEFLRGTRQTYCKARTASTAIGNAPQDCDWPWCGCDPVANRVLASIQEQGLKIVKE